MGVGGSLGGTDRIFGRHSISRLELGPQLVILSIRVLAKQTLDPIKRMDVFAGFKP